MSPLTFRKFAVSALFFLVASFGSLAVARADTVYSLTFNNFGQVGSLGTITTHVITAGEDAANAGNMLVTVNLNPNYVLHSNDALGWNVAAGFTGVTTIETLPHFTVGNGGSFNGFGSRTYSLDGETTSDARLHLDQSFSFIVNATQNFTSSDQVLDFAAQIALKDANGATGFAASGPEVPEPASMVLFGTGLIGIAAALRKRLRR